MRHNNVRDRLSGVENTESHEAVEPGTFASQVRVNVQCLTPTDLVELLACFFPIHQ